METTGKNRDQKDATKMVAEAVEIAKDAGVAVFGIGRSITMLTVVPKQAAAQLVLASNNLEAIADRVLELSEKIVVWDEKRIITQVKKPIVDANHNPIT